MPGGGRQRGHLRHKRRLPPMNTVMINDTPATVLIDTGASVNVMENTMYQRLSPKPSLSPSNTKIYTYGGLDPLPLQTTIEVSGTNQDHTTTPKLYVVKGNLGTLLGCHTAEDLELVFFARQRATRALQYIVAHHRCEGGPQPEIINRVGLLTRQSPERQCLTAYVFFCAQRRQRALCHSVEA
ncbi:hypothetical protein NDU88_001920 [Pleurodeles waltl]|uniref:Uncharacterized protein n=1 Tax=Pleurodeles waltl TaxID=8319 RepID=A0AAV7SCW6_PLEWA|nr:hypothetical protein NDU88_001920 [Pleurodeles waltl]